MALLDMIGKLRRALARGPRNRARAFGAEQRENLYLSPRERERLGRERRASPDYVEDAMRELDEMRKRVNRPL